MKKFKTYGAFCLAFLAAFFAEMRGAEAMKPLTIEQLPLKHSIALNVMTGAAVGAAAGSLLLPFTIYLCGLPLMLYIWCGLPPITATTALMLKIAGSFIWPWGLLITYFESVANPCVVVLLGATLIGATIGALVGLCYGLIKSAYARAQRGPADTTPKGRKERKCKRRLQQPGRLCLGRKSEQLIT